MQFSIHEDVPEAWTHIIDAFCTVAQYHEDFNGGVPVDDLNAFIKNQKLHLTYSGGDKIIDAFAFFAQEMAANICDTCALPSTRKVFGWPKCDDCE
jgi:hypothetical protein